MVYASWLAGQMTATAQQSAGPVTQRPVAIDTLLKKTIPGLLYLPGVWQPTDSLKPLHLPSDILSGYSDSLHHKTTPVLDTLQEKLNGLTLPETRKKTILPMPGPLNADLDLPSELSEQLVETGKTKKPVLEKNHVLEVPLLPTRKPAGFKKGIKVTDGLRKVWEKRPLREPKKLKIPAKTGSYSDQVTGILEKEAEGLKEIKAFKSKQAPFRSQLSEIAKLKEEKYARHKLISAASQQASGHFANQQKKLQAAYDKLAKLKKKYSGMEGLKEGKKQKASSLKGKPFSQRLVTGGYIQVHRVGPSGLDLSPLLAYRINKNFRAGIGGTYRIAIDADKRYLFSKIGGHYRYRVFGEHDVYKSFFGHLGFEKTTKALADRQADGQSGTWLNGGMVGIGRRTRFLKGIQGTVMVVYNFLYDVQGPYKQPWHIRFGLEVSGPWKVPFLKVKKP